MSWIVQNLWLIPVLPVVAAGLTAIAPQRKRVYACSLAIGSMVLSFLLFGSCAGSRLGLTGGGTESREVFNFRWFQLRQVNGCNWDGCWIR